MSEASESRDLREEGMRRAANAESNAFVRHYWDRMSQFVANIPVQGQFSLEDGHRLLRMQATSPQGLSAVSGGFIRYLLRNDIATEYGHTVSKRRRNHATRTRVYLKLR